MKLAIIFTCYNRAEKTEECLRSLLNQTIDKNIDLKFFICDDGSTDDTIQRINNTSLSAKIITGSGNLFWCRGMYLAMKSAYEEKSDFYLMINDDVKFYPTLIKTLLNSYEKAEEICGIVGNVVDEKNNATYGGKVFCNKYKIGRTRLVNPNVVLQKCDVANWNCFLIPHEVIENVGLIDNYYEHGCGDFDYSLMMKKKNYNIYVAMDYVGVCNANPITNTSQDKTLSTIIRIKKLFSFKESPIKSNIHFYYKNYGILGICYMVKFYLSNIINIMKR